MKSDIKYINKEYPGKNLGKDPEFKGTNTFIDWKKFSERYAGIEFRNYLYNDHTFKAKNIWYSTVDTDSTCIWDLSVVKSIMKIKDPIK